MAGRASYMLNKLSQFCIESLKLASSSLYRGTIKEVKQSHSFIFKVINIGFWLIWHSDAKGTGWVDLQLTIILMLTVGRFHMWMVPYYLCFRAFLYIYFNWLNHDTFSLYAAIYGLVFVLLFIVLLTCFYLYFLYMIEKITGDFINQHQLFNIELPCNNNLL